MSRRSKKKYFIEEPDAPKPLIAECSRVVRFEEVDPLTIVWHGRFPSFLEDGRAAFGKKYRMGYMDMYEAGFLAPIVQMHIDNHNPLQFGEEFLIRARLHWTQAVRMNFSYEIVKGDNIPVATGYTVQLFTDLQRNVMLVRPDYIEEFMRDWQEGKFL